MTQYNAPLRDMRFVMYEVLNAPNRWAQWPTTKEIIDQEIGDAILDECEKFSSRVIAPLNRLGDEEGCLWKDGMVTTPKGYKDAYKDFAKGGWVGLVGNPQFGGMGMPKVLGFQIDEMMCSASLSFVLYPNLTYGATSALESHASPELKSRYLPNLYSGKWTGTMCLTEPHAGTDLGIIKTKATPCTDGNYLINGTKIFITGGEHDLTENIIHLVLAKLPDAPPGTKGISLFLIPKINVNNDGSLADRNNVNCNSIEHKMGIKASATCVLNFDNAKGYLIGEINNGLAAMFVMMNHARLFVGVQGLGCGEMSYQNAVAYAKERLQGRATTAMLKTNKHADPILVHGDVRRMLLNMKAMNEAGRALSAYVAMQLDTAKHSENMEEKRCAADKASLLVPVVKAFLTDIGLEVCMTGQQIFGGHGYIRDSGQEQLVRDVRITQIYEGTNGIQSLDLLGRKIVHNNGAVFKVFANEIRLSLEEEQQLELTVPLSKALKRLENLTSQLIMQSQHNPNAINAACVEYLHAFAYVTYGWMWLLMAQEARKKLKTKTVDQPFYQGKLILAQHYFKRLLPRFYALADAAESGTDETLYALTNDQF
ncbi:MAG: acyl-CoA dehydrogenase C-terminal domain-containing protein [Candidatus Endonucleobacter sp. (ex Gigantidas childressi)]|nr:acyl-CoA dehydrogenase C-terminal domain-containing protein [Candidatus Endonucleobacter sp. (ex Gigantidas childressi)]